MLELPEIDRMTGLGSRRAFLQILEAELQRATAEQLPLSLLMLDIDHCHVYNHDFGHTVGDLAIQQLARLLQNEVGTAGVVTRYGGDEFAVLLPLVGGDEARLLAERLCVKVTSYAWPHRPMTVSIGWTTLARVAADVSDLVRDADEALHQAKSAGRNTFAP